LQITGKAYRVPTRTGSIAELNLVTEKPCTTEEVNDAFRRAARQKPLQGVMDVLEDAWSSARIIGDSHSSLIDLPLTQRQGGLISVASWYDNEWAFACRLAEVAAFLAAALPVPATGNRTAWETSLSSLLLMPVNTCDARHF
jgi:glyceraldehyde 3-phosphate dehydrogenase